MGLGYLTEQTPLTSHKALPLLKVPLWEPYLGAPRTAGLHPGPEMAPPLPTHISPFQSVQVSNYSFLAPASP